MKKLKTTLDHLRRTPYQSLSAVAMTTVTFFIISLFALVVMGGQRLLAYFESRPQVTAYFKDSATRDDATKLEETIRGSVAVDSAHFVSKDDALAIYREQNKSDPLLLEMVTADILPSSLEISAKNVADLERVSELMNADTHVEEVSFQKDVVGVLEAWIKGVRLGGLILSSLLLLASLMTIMVILGLRFSMRRAEINTLSLLGATPWYIRAPFLLEGVVYASLGSVFGWGTAYILLLYLSPNLVEFFRGIPLLPVPPLLMLGLLGGELLLGAFLGLVASASATRRLKK